MTECYQLVYAKKAQFRTASGSTVILSSSADGPSIRLDINEYELAQLFDGLRSLGEVLDAFYKARQIRLTREDVSDFVATLVEAGLLKKVEVEQAAAPASRQRPLLELMAGQRRRDAGGNDIMSRIVDFRQQRESMRQRMGSQHGHGSHTSGNADANDYRHRKESQPGAETFDGSAEVIDVGPAPRFSPGIGIPPGLKKRLQGPRIWLHLPIRYLLPLGGIMALPVRSRIVFWLMMLAAAGLCFGAWVNRVELVRDLERLLIPLTLAHTLVVSAFSVNLLGQLARAHTFRRATGNVPKFGIILALNLIPRFYTNLSGLLEIRDAKPRRRVLAASVWSSLLLFVIAGYGWLLSKGADTFLPQLFSGIALLSGVLFLLAINPLSKREGYYLLTGRLGVPDLRERALASMFGRADTRARARDLPATPLRLYGLLVVVYLVTLCYLVISILGVWLEKNWQGLGVIVFLFIISLAMIDPIRRVRAQGEFKKMRPTQRPLPAAMQHKRKGKRRVRPMFTLALIVSLLALLGSLPYRYEPGGDFIILPNHRADVRALTAGDIRQILVSEGELVKPGQILGVLADDEERKNIAVSESRLVELNAKLAIAQQGATAEEIDLARQKVTTARTKATFSQARAERLEELFGRKLVSGQEYENALSQSEVDREKLNEELKNLALLRSGSRPEEIAAIEAEIAKETSQIEYHRQRLQYTQIRATVAGHIVSGTLKYAVGDYLSEGELLATIEDTSRVRGEIRIPQADIGEVKIGSEVKLKAWAYPYREFSGVVVSIAPNAEDSEYGKVVRVLTEIVNEDAALKSQMTGNAKVRGPTMPVALAFTRMLQRFIVIEVWSWLP